MASLDRTARSFLLSELVGGFLLTFKYMFKPKVTLNYPYEKWPLGPRFRGEPSQRVDGRGLRHFESFLAHEVTQARRTTNSLEHRSVLPRRRLMHSQSAGP